LYFRGSRYWKDEIHSGRPEVKAHWSAQLNSYIAKLVQTAASHGQVKPNEVRVVGLVDAKNYWRSELYNYQQSLLDSPLHFKIKKQETPDTAYKGNRLEKKSYNGLLKLLNGLMWELPYPVLKAEGAEADDFFGALAKAKPEETPLYGATLDKDWMLCCEFRNTYMINLHRKYNLSIIDEAMALESFKAEYRNVEHLRDVPLAKSLKGERSDNLPKGFDPRLANLISYSLPDPDSFRIPGEFEPQWDFTEAWGELRSLLSSLGIPLESF
jgi:hypothetical protein